MYPFSLNDVLLTMSASLFLLGMVTFIAGVFILVTRAASPDVRAITQHAAQLAQKGLTDDIAGLVGNASVLLKTMAEMVRTATGIGMFLTLTGTLLMGAGFGVILQIN